MSKNNYDNLYVGSEIKIGVYYERGRQYDCPYYGFIVCVSRKRRLFYSALDENGEMCFYDYKTRQKVKELAYESSMIVEVFDEVVPKFERLEDENGEICFYDYKTKQKVKELAYESSMFAEVFDKAVHKYKDSREQIERLEDGVGYFIPFNEYMYRKNYEWYKKYRGKMTPALANAILKYTNHFENGYVKLSSGKQEAYREISDEIGYNLNKLENKIKK